ncbi:alanine racemase [Radiobacillus kanasensis]|uniref:alanine racemase n=1 Tax=Radiobacillus kanasensis TaxID=2844358 RepID=UPI001E56D108|nr:alanine racemase [Radiobacillus kanasensis]UFU01314.1 alanine racemase [Radiobacillus kanasensis]
MEDTKFYRDTWAEIDLARIEYNIHQLQKRLTDTKIYAVVKANGYGHGDIEVAKRALKAGAKGLAVATLDEALKLRKAGLTAPLLVMGWSRPEDASVAIIHDITLTVYQKEWLIEVKQNQVDGAVKVHIKLDTGMGRLGVRTNEELLELLHELQSGPFELEGAFTHFATADEQDYSYFEKQQERLDSFLHCLEKNWSKPIIIHTGNSAASMRFPEKMQHFTRFGVSMYGLYPSDTVKKEKPIDLQQAFSLHSKLVHVKKLPPGEGVSYGATYVTEEEEWIGTIPIGYADGYIRKLQGSDVLVEGKRMPIVGRICMDQCMIRLDKEYPIGTNVTLIGKQGDEEISIDELADHLETINYEIPCMIGPRVPRVYSS